MNYLTAASRYNVSIQLGRGREATTAALLSANIPVCNLSSDALEQRLWKGQGEAGGSVIPLHCAGKSKEGFPGGILPG